MNEKRRRIIWQHCPEKYINPSGPSIEEIEQHVGAIIDKKNSFGSADEISEAEIDFENFAEAQKMNFWCAHVNFTINEPIQKALESCDGVEVLKIRTRYCFIIAVGQLFDFEYVRKEINKALQIQETNLIDTVIKDLEKTATYWSILVKKDGFIEYSAAQDADNLDRVLADAKYYQAYVDRYHGKVINSDSVMKELDESNDI